MMIVVVDFLKSNSRIMYYSISSVLRKVTAFFLQSTIHGSV